ncbi:MAG: TylF/MycF/NovP-related O-methyltransferase [Candidatus Saccharibacteria bacterium]|nr:TylF/MycF/NovP-related O-methyltransferase [Candidatus Saccharibacteria bacterium]
MSDISKLVAKHTLVSDQVSQTEIIDVLTELDRVLADNIIGDVVEFGCYKGTSSLFLARLLLKYGVNKRLWLYDSFAGLPEKSLADDTRLGDEFQPGELVATKAEVIRNFNHANLPRPIIKKGWFCDLTREDIPAQISFAYFDGDYYDSIRDSFRLCEANFTAGAIIVVDDYNNTHLPGAAKAVDEWRRANAKRIKSFVTRNSLAIIRLI